MNGLIYGALVLMWAVVLLPMWVRRHDEASETPPMDRFTNAMRVLSRRDDRDRPGRRVDHREVVMRAPEDRRGTRMPSRPAPDVPRRPSGLARRRRRMLIVLALLGATVGAVVALGYLPAYAVAAPVLLLLGFLVHLRLGVRRERDRQRRQQVARLRARSRSAEPSSTRTTTPAYVSSDAYAAQRTSRRLPSAPPQEVVGLVEHEDRFDPVTAQWSPVPVPLPTYVTAPRAAQPVRVIDLGGSGAWTSGRLTAAEQAMAEQARLEQEAVADQRAELVDPAVPDAAPDESTEKPRRAVGD